MIERYKGTCLGTGQSQAVFQAASPHMDPNIVYRNTVNIECLMVTQLKNLCALWIKHIFQPRIPHLSAESLPNKAANFTSLSIAGNTINTANIKVI